MSPIKGILFDKDGTLVDFHATWFAIGDRLALEAAGGDRIEADRMLQMAGYDFVAGRFKADSVFAAGTNADIVALWYPGLSAHRRDLLVARFNLATAEEGAAGAVALPGAVKALAALHSGGFRLGVATNDSTHGAERTLRALGVAQHFDAAYGYDAVANPKPAPDAVISFCDFTGLKPTQMAIVGDNAHDIDMARAAGVRLAIGVLSGTGTTETLCRADHILESVADLPAFLGQFH